MTWGTWRKFANHAGLWVLTVFAIQGFFYYLGLDMLPLESLLIMLGAGLAVTWLILRFNPTYYDRPRAKPADQRD